MAAINLGPTTWSLERDPKDGYTVATVEFKVTVTDVNDGPNVVLTADGLPQPGDFWSFRGDEVNLDLRFTAGVSVKPMATFRDEPITNYLVTFTATDKPANVCNRDVLIADPLLEPPTVNFESRDEPIEATEDRNGFPITNSAWEPLRGEQVKFHDERSAFTVQVNLATVDRAFVEGMLNCLNDQPIWGYAAETVRFDKVNFTQKFHGSCECYHFAQMTFVWRRDGWERDVLDEASKVLRGEWKPDGSYEVALIDGKPASPTNPRHFDKATDRRGNPVRLILNGAGVPSDVVVRVGGKFLSLGNGNVGNPVDDGAYWLALSSDPAGKPWVARGWKRGSVVTFTDNFFAALRDVPPSEADPLSAPEFWEALGPVAPVDEGEWTAPTTYSKGQYVLAPGSVSGPGSVHVAYYETNNFLLLQGLPLALDCPGG